MKLILTAIMVHKHTMSIFVRGRTLDKGYEFTKLSRFWMGRLHHPGQLDRIRAILSVPLV